ncbi:MAG: hypothetical protein OHK0019_09460 [Saprospiraceae bacterium]
MKTGLITSYPEQSFWDDFAFLWAESTQRSVFQGPHFIRYLAEKVERNLAVFVWYRGNRLCGVVFLQNDGGTYKLLSDIKSDYNFITIHRDCSETDVRAFFNLFFDEIKKRHWALIFNYQPSWATYLNILEEEAKKAGLFVAVSKHSVCPVLEGENPKAILDWFNGLKNYRYYVNRLKKQQNAVFEVFTGEEELDKWANEFCACHVKRWTNTATPSQYNLDDKQDLTREVFRAWAKDNALTRFSIRIGDERIAFNVALRQSDALVGHAQAYDPEYGKFSPGKALMYFIGEWMSQNGFKKIDFGKGGEAYKFGMTNGELELYKIFISSYSNVPFVVKSKLEKSVRSNKGFISVYRSKIKPTLQYASIRVRSSMSKFF